LGAPGLLASAAMIGALILIVISVYMLWKTNRIVPPQSRQDQGLSQEKDGSQHINQDKPGSERIEISNRTRETSPHRNPRSIIYKPAKAEVISLEILPGLPMGGELRSVVLPAKSKVLRLIMHLEDSRHQIFRVELSTDEDGKIWSRDDLKIRRGKTDGILE